MCVRVFQDYAANLNHFVDEGPFYIYFKDVLEVSDDAIASGLMVDIARENGGALFTFDQRYFGKNNITRYIFALTFVHSFMN